MDSRSAQPEEQEMVKKIEMLENQQRNKEEKKRDVAKQTQRYI